MTDPDVTQLLRQLEAGRREVFNELLARVYPSLREIARAKMRMQPAGITLNTTGLVHEAYLNLVRYQDIEWKGRAHFFGAASQAMRRILVDQARARNAQKRSGIHVSLTKADLADEVSLERLIELDDALQRLAEARPQWVQVVECRYFGDMTIEEIAEVLGVSPSTVSNYWRLARAWLLRELDAG